MNLRHGFTTGTAAAAAAKAATIHLLTGTGPQSVDVPLPAGGRLTIPVLESRPCGNGCLAAVVKDAGDDPDVTNGAVIRALVLPRTVPGIELRGGHGVGTVTKPGLPVSIGQPAINPVPQAQIRDAVRETALEADSGVIVEIRVDNGEELAKKTFNPRLGIVGGISILGTRGTVKPFSHWAYQATIRQSLDVMQACGIARPCLTTGGRSERFLRLSEPDVPEEACVQVADFFFFSMREAGRCGFGQVLWGVFFGKLVKQAQGARYTHARSAELDLKNLAAWANQSGFEATICDRISEANTARQVLEDITSHPQAPALFALLTDRARSCAKAFAGPAMAVDYLLFDFSGQILHDTRETA